MIPPLYQLSYAATMERKIEEKAGSVKERQNEKAEHRIQKRI